jgi:nucleolar protein 12
VEDIADSSEEDTISEADNDSEQDAESVTGSDSAASPSAGNSASEDEDAETESALARIRASVLDEPEKPNKKRKRGKKDDAVEDVYMERIAREEAKDEEKRIKKQKTKAVETDGATEVASGAEDSDDETFIVPKHETLVNGNGTEVDEVEKASRTVFLGNVSSEAIVSKSAEKQLKQHLSSFIADLADNKPPHKVESIRFRSTAFASALPKRAAYAKKEVMDSTTKSTNAYVVYSTKVAAREAAKRLNGTIVLGRHLRVDSIAHPAKVDHRRCIFVGNLGFVDDESNADAEGDEKKKKNRPPSDVEEGLWVQFSKAGKVESVRVPRDSKTRVGKGFAYVQFEDENAVEAALLFNEQKYPPLLPRKLRVTRARAQKKKDKKPAPSTKASAPTAKGAYNAKIPEEQSSMQGRARAMLGKAGKAGAFKSAESFVFEGHRASSKQGKSGLKLGGKKGKSKGPNGRKSRSQAWKSSGGKK